MARKPGRAKGLPIATSVLLAVAAAAAISLLPFDRPCLCTVDGGDSFELVEKSSLASQLVGFSSSRQVSKGAVFPGVGSVQSRWCLVPLDVVYLDDEGRVLEVEQLDPGKQGQTVEGARHVVELPCGEAEKQGIEVGSRLSFPGNRAD